MTDNSPKVSKSIFVTGGSGFVGSAIIDRLLADGYTIRALVNKRPIDRDGVTSIRGDLFNDDALDAGLAGCDAAIHLVGIIRETPSRGQTFERLHHEGAVRVINAAKRNNVRRFILMSALGVRPDSPSEYAATKAKAEAHLVSSGLDYTIMRPSVIHGPGGEFMTMLSDWSAGRALPYLFMPYFGTGLFGQHSKQLQPIHVDDCAAAFVAALVRPTTIGQTIDLAGPDRLTWPGLYRIVTTLLRGRAKASIGIPTWYAKLLTRIVPASLLPFNRSQVVMAGEDNTADVSATADLIGTMPKGFEEAFKTYAERL